MSWIATFYRSALGKKAVMAVTGIFLFGWIFLHMLGNLKVYLGPEHYNEYAKFLITMGSPLLPNRTVLIAVRILLLIALVLHIDAATRLTIMNRKARPAGYRERKDVVASYAARTMRWSGVIIFLFVIYHLLHLTFGEIRISGERRAHSGSQIHRSAGDADADRDEEQSRGTVIRFHPNFVPDDPYHNFVTGFQVWWASAIYIVANLALGLHLYHGLWSMFMSLGLTHPKLHLAKRVFATGFALVITLANVLFPIMVLMGVLR